ncbi:MAG: hypothetical protein HYY06_11730 [Deltaproteobacteria bacterium]|nr:hypothetical protein [Deltaproteobacteria bacterium]
MAADPAATAARVVTSLEARGVPCAIGGALCLAYWGVPRATKDLDLNVFVSEAGVDRLLDALEAASLTVDRDAARHRVAARGDLVAFDGDMRVDVFVSFHAFHDEVASRVVRGTLPDGTAASFLSGEDLCVFKTLFYRAKDLVDLDRLFAARGAELDFRYVERWLGELLGPDDERPGELRQRFDRAREGPRSAS